MSFCCPVDKSSHLLPTAAPNRPPSLDLSPSELQLPTLQTSLLTSLQGVSPVLQPGMPQDPELILSSSGESASGSKRSSMSHYPFSTRGTKRPCRQSNRDPIDETDHKEEYHREEDYKDLGDLEEHHHFIRRSDAGSQATLIGKLPPRPKLGQPGPADREWVKFFADGGVPSSEPDQTIIRRNSLSYIHSPNFGSEVVQYHRHPFSSFCSLSNPSLSKPSLPSPAQVVLPPAESPPHFLSSRSLRPSLPYGHSHGFNSLNDHIDSLNLSSFLTHLKLDGTLN